VTTQAAEQGFGAGVTQAAEEGLRAGVAEAAAECLGAGVTEAEEEQAEETAETSEGAGRDRRAVLLGLLGVGVSATTRRLVTSPSGAAFRCRLVAPDFGLVRDAGGAAALFEGRIVGVWTACGKWESGGFGEREGEPGGEGKRAEAVRERERNWKACRGRLEKKGSLVFVDRRGLQLYGLRWAMTQYVVNSQGFGGFKIYWAYLSQLLDTNECILSRNLS
jgi:hypothetical protein